MLQRSHSLTLALALAVAAIGLPIAAAEPATTADPATIAAAYIKASTAQAKADSALGVLTDDMKTPIDALSQKLEGYVTKTQQAGDALRQTEEKKGTLRDPILVDTYDAAKKKIDADWRTGQEMRIALHNRWRQAQDVSGQLRNVFTQLSNADRALREARLDPTPMAQAYASVEAKASETDTEAKAVLSEFTALCKTWEDRAAADLTAAPAQ